MLKNLIIVLIFTSLLTAQTNFNKYFNDKSLRLDYIETGNNISESFSFVELVEEPYWGGSKNNLVDNLGYGYYKVVVKDFSTNKVIYSRGFSTLFDEWQTTNEAKTVNKAYNGAVVFPYPKDSVKVEIHKRDSKNVFVKRFEYVVDPNSYFVKKDRELVFEKKRIHYSGDYADKLDIVLLPEGYTKDELSNFEQQCNDFAKYLFRYEPFKSNEDKFNIWAVMAPSIDSGVDIPGDNVWKKTILNSSFFTFDSERYLMTDDFRRVCDVASNAPYDQIYILANTSKYGGGAIYNFYSCTAANNEKTEKIFIHELGHGLAGLADEYYTSSVSYVDYYPPGVEPWEENITTLVNFESKWKDLLPEGTKVPTEVTVENEGKIGVYEGGGYVAKGVYRPTINSVMKTLSAPGFNEVSIRAIEKVIKYYTE